MQTTASGMPAAVAGAGRLRFRAQLAALLIAGAVAFVATGQEATDPSVLAGAYSEEQAIRGQALYYEHCLACHGEQLGGLDQAPPLAGPQFSDIWVGEPLAALLDRLETMPPSAPGSLAREQNVDILAFMLWYNGLPMGDVELSAEAGILAKARFQLPVNTFQ